MKCDDDVCQSVRAVFVGVLFTSPSVGQRFFLQATETCPNYEKNFTTCQDLKNAENSNCSSSTGFGRTMTTMTKLLEGSATSLTQMSAGFPTCIRVNGVVEFFMAFKLLPFSLSYWLTARNISVFSLDSLQVLVMQSFAFSFTQVKSGR